jgi:putative addiction module CopG family antidote
MTIHATPAVERAIQRQIAGGRYASETEVLESALRALEAQDQWFVDLHESLDEMQAGQTLPVEEVFDEVRRELGWTTRTS